MTFALVDARAVSTYNLEKYVGKQPEEPFSIRNNPNHVKRMAEPLFGTGCNITADNWFTNTELINDLKKEPVLCWNTWKK